MSDIVERLRIRRNPTLDGEREEAADEIERLRTSNEEYERVNQKFFAEILNTREERDAGRQIATQRGARMQIMREWMMPNDWQHFVIAKPQASAWFDEDGVPR